MAITQLNTADFDYEMMLNVINKSYKGKADITISEYSTTAAPDVKVGSVFEDNGAIFLVDTADITPSGYGGISNSTTFYLYYDEDPGAFTFSSTAPTWNDALQGWYNANDRAFFSMFKDSGGSLYENKLELIHQNKNQIAGGLQTDNVKLKTKVVEIDDWNMGSTTATTVTHGIADFTKIRSMVAVVRPDDSGSITNLAHLTAATGVVAGGISNATTVSVVLQRTTGGIFTTGNYNTTSFNRGWITIIYVE